MTTDSFCAIVELRRSEVASSEQMAVSAGSLGDDALLLAIFAVRARFFGVKGVPALSADGSFAMTVARTRVEASVAVAVGESVTIVALVVKTVVDDCGCCCSSSTQTTLTFEAVGSARLTGLGGSVVAALD